MTLTDGTSRIQIAPRWEEEDQILAVQGRAGEDIVVQLKLRSTDDTDDLQLEFIRGDRPMPPNRYRLQMRGNIVQLTLKQSQKDDTGQYALVATRIGQPFEKGSTRRIHLRVDEPSYEEGEPPIFLRRLTDLAVKVGTRTRFLVEIRSSTNPKVTWHRNDLPIQAGSRFSFVHEGNFYCVDVAPVKVEDQGNWTCMAENQSGRSSCTSHLSVIVPKAYKRPEFVEELRALLTETGTVSLECKVVGVPTPVLRWFKDNKEIKAGDVFALTANPDDPTSLGIYTCEADNCMGTAYSSSKVHVVGKGSREGSLKPADTLTSTGPPPVFKRILRDECCRIGDSVTLSCQVHVPPWPKSITWYNQEGRIEPNEKYHVMEDGLGGYSIEVKLIEAMDEGEWKCVATSAENVKQFTTCHVAVIIPKNYRKPRFMESLKAVLTEEGLVSFECKVVGFPTPLLRWFKDGQELKPGDVYQLTGTNSLGSYCCIARNCMGEAKSTAELTIEDIQNQLNEEERLQLLTSDKPPKFVRGLRSCEAKINEELFRFTVQVSISPEPILSWYRDDVEVIEGDKFRTIKENLGTCHLEVRQLEISDQAEWKCVAANDYGHSVTSCFLKLIIPKHYKKPKFLESLRAILSEEGAVNLECKVIGVPQPILKWYKDGMELKPGDIHRIITGQDGTCCLGTYTCEAINCMGKVSSSASLLGFEDKISARKDTKEDVQLSANGHELARNLSLSTIHEERTSQLYDTPQTDRSVTFDDRGEVSFSFDGKEVSVSLYETPDLTEEEALQIVEMYADQLSEHVTEHNVIELPPMRFVKESSTSGNLLMEAVVIDVSPDYFVSAEDGDDLRTEADFEDVSIMDDQTRVFSSPDEESLSLKRSARYTWEGDEKPPMRPPRKKSTSRSSSKSEEKSEERSQRYESESFHSARKDDDRPISPLSSERLDDSDHSTTFADALSSARLSISEQNKQNKSAIRENEEIIGGDKTPFSSDDLEAKEKRHSLKRKVKKEKSTSEESASSIMADLDVPKEGDGEQKKQKKRKKKKRKEEEEEEEEEEEKKKVLDKKDEVCRRIESIDTRVDVEDSFGKINDTEKVSTIESDKSPSKNNKERILNKIKRLTEPVLAIRDSLVDIDRYDKFLELESEERSRDVVSEGIVRPIQTLCEEVSSIEAKALKNTEDRSLDQTIRISLLESIGGPTEELLRGIELIDSQRSFKGQRQDVIKILESLTDPVDEILMGLTKIEYELTGKAKGEKPVSFLRMSRAVSRLDESLKSLSKEKREPIQLLSFLDKLVNTLNLFLQDVSVNPMTGTIETVDTVLVESLSRSIEETVGAINWTESSIERRPNDGVSRLTNRLLHPTRELKAKLDTLTVALEKYESKGDVIMERRAELIISLRESVNDALADILDLQEKVRIEEKTEEYDALRSDNSYLEESEYVFEDTRLALREALEIYETISGSLDPRFAAVFDEIKGTYEKLCLKGKEVNAVETLLGMEEQLNVLRDALTDASTINDSANVLKLLAPSVSRLTVATRSLLNLSSVVQPILSICSNIDDIVQGHDINRESEKTRSSSARDAATFSEKLLDPLIEIQTTLSAAIQDLEDIRSAVNGGTVQERILMTHDFSSILTDLRQCISDAARAAMSSKESEMFHCLADVKEPLLDLRVMLASKDESALAGMGTLKERLSTSIVRLQDAITMILIAPSPSNVAVKSIKTKAKNILEILKGIQVVIPKVPEEIAMETIYDRQLEDLNVDEKLGSINYSLTSVLEKQREITVSSSLANSIEALRENVASSAVAIATMKTPKDNEKIAKEVTRLGKPLLILQRALLTEDHKAEEEVILNDLINPIGRLKRLMEDIAKVAKSSIEIIPLLELLEEIEKDVILIAKETSKRKGNKSTIISREEKASSSLLADTISRSLDPIRGWLSSMSYEQDSTEASGLSSSVDELKRDVTRIAIETSYSEPPNDRTLIEALAELREPLMRLKNAIAMYHEPEDLSALETLSRPMRYLLKTVTRVLEDHAAEESLRLILDIVEEIENQIPISIKEALYKRELRQVVQTLEDNNEEETLNVTRETDGIVEMEESGKARIELDEERSDRSAIWEVRPRDDIITKNFISSLSKMLENVQLEVTGIIEDLEEPTTGIMTIPQTKLSTALEEFCKMISTVRMALSDYDEQVLPSSDEIVTGEPLSMINHLLKPLIMIEEALNTSEELDVAELSILNRLKRPLEDTELYILQPSMEISGNDRSREKFEQLIRVLEETKAKIPIAMKEVSSRKEILGYLRDISKPLESIQEQMRGLETIPEETLEKDVAKILVEPIDSLLRAVNTSSHQTRIPDQRKEVIKEMRKMTGPLVEFLSCLSVVKSSRKSLVPVVALLDERKNVILKAVEELRLEICDILEKIKTIENDAFFEVPLISLNDAILSVRSQVERTDYTPRPSTTSIHFQNCFIGSLNRLRDTIDALEEGTEKSPQGIIAKSLEPLKKQISLSRSQFSLTSDQFVDEEVIVEGFLYPTNQLRSALGALKESIENGVMPPFTSASLGLLENLADSIADLAHSLSSHRAGLIGEGASEGSSIVETFSAALEVLENVKTSIKGIRDMTVGRKETGPIIESTMDKEYEEEIVGTTVIERKVDESAPEGERVPAKTEDRPEKDEGKKGIGDNKVKDIERSKQEEDVGNESQSVTIPRDMSLPDEGIGREPRSQRLFQSEKQEETSGINVDKSVIKENDESGTKLTLEERIDEKFEKGRDGAIRVEVKDENRLALGPREGESHEMKLERKDIVEEDDSGEIRTIEKIPSEEAKEISSGISEKSVEHRSKDGEESKSKSPKTKTVVVDEIVQITKEEVESAMKVVEETLPAGLDTPRGDTSNGEMPTNESISRNSSESRNLGENALTRKDVKPDEQTCNVINAGAETAKAIESVEKEFAEMPESVQVDRNAEIIKRIVTTMRTLEAPMKELTKFINSAKKEPLTVKSEEENRKIRELTALIQILNDLRATSVSIRCSPAFSAYSNSEELFSNIINSVDTMERATASILILTQEHLVPELKEKSLLALRNLANPLESIEKSFSAVLQVEGISRLTTEERKGLSMAMGDLVGIISILKETVCSIDNDVKSVTIAKPAEIEGANEMEPSAEMLFANVEPSPKGEAQRNDVPTKEEIIRETVETLGKVREDEDASTPIDEVEKSSTLGTTDVQRSVIVEAEDVGNDRTMFLEANQDFQEQRAGVTIEQKEPLSISIQSIYVKYIENVIGPIQELRGSLSQMKEGQVALVHPLEELEESLRQFETTIARDESSGEGPSQRANVKSLIEELEKSIATIEEGITCASIPLEIATVELSLKKLQTSTATLRQLFDRNVESQKVIEEDQSHVPSIDNKKDVECAKYVRTTPPVQELREAIMDLAKSEIEETGTLEETGIAFALTKWIEPLEQLENTFFSILDERLDVPFKESSSITTTLEDLKTFVHCTQECLAIGQKKLASFEDTKSLSLMRKAVESLEDLETSIAIVRRSSIGVKDANERLSYIENVPISVLQNLAKAIEEVKRDCTVIFLEPKVLVALAAVSGRTTPLKENVAMLGDVITPVRLLQESIATIEQGKIYEAEELKGTEETKPVSLLSTLVDPLQRLEKIFVVATQRERAIIEEETADLPESEEGAEILSLSPILEEMDKSLATIQEQVTLEGGTESAPKSDENVSQLVRTMAKPLVELRASIAAIQKVEEMAAEHNLHELSDMENVNALETFAKSLYELAERIAVIDEQRAIFETAADTMSEGASSLKTWANVAEDESPPVKVTRAMTIDQGTVESPTEAVSPFSEEEDAILRTLAKPLEELREFLALIVEERRTTETTSPMIPKEDPTLMNSIAKPLLELKNVAAMVIEEKLAIESAREKAFGEDGGPAMSIDPLVQPLEEVCNSIAIIQDQVPIETLQEERPFENELALLSVLAEPLLDLQRCIMVLEERVISPDVEPLPQELSKANWTTKECVAVTTLQEIEKSIGEICERVTAIQADTVKVNEPSKITTQDRIIIDKLIEPVEGIISMISNVREEMMPLERRIEYQALMTLLEPLKAVSVSFSLLRDEANINIGQEEANVEVIVESLSNLERCISIVEEQAIDKPLADPLYGSEVDKTVISALRLPLVELKRSILKVEDSPTEYLRNLEKPLINLRATLETISTDQENPTAIHRHTLPSVEMTKLSIKLIDAIVGINESVESVEHKIRDQIGRANIDRSAECEKLKVFNETLQDLKKCMVKIQEEGTLERGPIMASLSKIHESIAFVRKEYTQRSDPQFTDICEHQTILQPLSQHFDTLNDTIASIQGMKKEDVTSERLETLEKPLRNLHNSLNDLRDKLLTGEILWMTDLRIESSQQNDTDEQKDDKIKDNESEEQPREKEETEDNLRKDETEKCERQKVEREQREEIEKQKCEEEERANKEDTEKVKDPEDERKRIEENEKLKLAEEDGKKREEAEKLKLQEEERLRKEEAEKRMLEEEERKKKEDDEKLKLAGEERKKNEEAEKLKLEEEERKRKEEADKLKLEEDERKKKEEGEKLKLQEEQRLKKEEAEELKLEEEERKKKEDDEKLKLAEEERKKNEEAEKLKLQEEERLKKEEAEKLKLEEEERKNKEDDEKLKLAEEERKKNEEAEKLKLEEEERKKKEEVDKLKLAEEDGKKREEAEKLKLQEEERLRKEEAEELKLEEEERKKKEDDEKLKLAEEERKKNEEAEKLKLEDEERKKKEEAEKLKLEEEERKKKEEAEKLKLEDEERKKKEEAEKLKLEEEERKKKEEAEKLKLEEEERKKKEEAEKLKLEEEKRKEKEEAEKLKLEEEERKKKEEVEKLKLEEEERKKKEEAEKLKLEDEERKKKEEAEKLKLDEEKRKEKEEAEKLKLEEEERKKKEEAEKLKLEDEERKKKEEAEKLKLEEEERKKKEEAEKLKLEEEERKKKEEAEKLKLEEEKRKEKEEAEKLKLEEEERKKKEEVEKLKLEEEERKKKEEAEKLKLEDEERKKKEEAEKFKLEEEERKKKVEAEKLELEEEERKKKEEEAKKLKLEDEERKKKEEAEKLKLEEEERKKQEEAEKLKLEEEERKKKEEAEKLKLEDEERKKEEEAEKQKLEEEERRKKEEAEKLKLEDEERKKKEEAEKLKLEEEERKKKEEAEKLKLEEEERKKKEEAEKLKLEEEKRKEKEEAEKLKLEEEERKKKEEAEKLKLEEEERKKKEEAEKLKLEVEKRKEKEEAEKLKLEEEERKKKEEAEKLKLEEEERKKKEEAEKLKLEDEERKKKEEAEKLKLEEEERKKKEEAEKLKLEEEKRKEKEEAEKLKLEEEERKKKEEAEKLKLVEEERKKKEEAEKLKLEEEKRKEKEEAEKLKLEEEERKKKEEAEKLKLEEEERKKKEEAEKLKLEDEERKKKEEAEKLKLEEEERKKKEEAEKLKLEEEERKKKEEAEKLKLEEEERKKKEEAEKLKLEEEERKKKEEAEKLKLEEEERKKKEEAEKLKLEEEERKKKEEAEKLKLEEEERKKKEEAEKLKLEEEESKKKEEAEKLKLEDEERKKKEEAEKLKLEEEKRKEKEEAEKLKLEEEERKKKEEAEKLKLEEEERKKKEEAEKLKLEEEESKKKEEAEKLKLEEVERKRKEEVEKLKLEEEERKKEEEGEKLKLKEEGGKNEEAEKLNNEEVERKRKDDENELNHGEEERRMVEMKQIEREIEGEGKMKSKDERMRLEHGMNEEKEKIMESEEDERRRKRKERRRVEEEEMLRREGAERLRLEEERRKRKEEAERSRKDREERLKMQEMERLERKRAEERLRKEDFGRMRKEEEERRNRREKERQVRREESARLLREEEDRLRRRHEEELSAINKRRRDRARDENWSRLRENESDRFLKSLDDVRSRSSRLSRISPDRRSRSYRVDSDLQLDSTLSDSSRSYSWRESLASSGRRSIDDYMDYKLHESSLNRSLYDIGSYYGTRRRREERINRARSISLLKYDEYYMGDTDSTVSYSSSSKPPRCGRIKIPSHIEYDDLDTISFDSIMRDKGKKPSFCTRLTNRTVGEGMRTRLTCTVLGNPEPRVYWRKDGQELSPTSNKYQTRFDNGMAYFELKEAHVEDSGVYTCVAENIHGSTSTESTLKVYRDFVQPLSPPTFTKSIKDTYRHSNHELALECRVRGYPCPTISWLKDGKVLDGGRYTRKYLDDGIHRLEISNPDTSDSGRYVCRATNEIQSTEMSHIVHFEGRDQRSPRKRGRITEEDVEASRRPRFSNFLSDHSVPTGGTIALQVEVKGMPAPEVRWLHGERKEPISISKAKTFAESGVHTLIVPEATESERGTYICRAVNAYGYVDTAATIEIISPGAIDGGKPAMFVSRPSEKSIAVAIGEDVSVSFRITGVPKPRVTWMKGIKDITDGPRSYKEGIDDYVRLTLKRAIPSDEGTYCILVKNRYGCDRSFFSIWIKQRARSLTPLPGDWGRSDAGSIQNEDELSYVKDVPGPISSEPVVVDGGRNWLSLSWGKAERRGPAPVIAYKVDAWLMGGDGGARWVELGITPINAIDAFNLRPGGEYRFRVTPRNRYGWGESVTTSNSFTVSEVVDLPEFIKILPGQLKALKGSTIKLECEIRGEPNINIKWYRETAEIDPNNDSRYSIGRRGLRSSLTIDTIEEDDSGRYICEASNKVGKVSSFARVLVVTDPKIIEADEKLRSRILGDEREERPPQFAMRLRDRRVQVTYPVRLTCQIMGYPAPEITWFKNAVEIIQDERHVFWDDDSNFHTLEIIHSTLEDSGCYMVTAKNIHGSVSCRSILVVDKGIRAYVAPEFLYGLDAVYAVRLNDELRMSAQIEAYPSVGVVWHRDGLRLRPSRRTIMTLSHDGTVELSLAKVTSRDAGMYSCTAVNEVGRAETSTRVNVIVGSDVANDKQIESLIEGLPTVTIASPDVPYSKEPLFVTKPLSTEALEGDTVIILCEVVGDPKPEVIWLRDFLKELDLQVGYASTGSNCKIHFAIPENDVSLMLHRSRM
ncbi:titin homolog isoform X6 [Vespa velutina]|uniref:titin homolog isoform X6 n=1 Tax=Vespa velutina TaxID=202808 RepID=UPI001FB53813|nr:titin homolog isoform X6 [Vespa velutina]